MGKEAIKMELEKRALPEVLRLADSTAVNTPELWGKRREEIREILQEECYGRMPRTGWETEWEEKPYYGQWRCGSIPIAAILPIRFSLYCRKMCRSRRYLYI